MDDKYTKEAKERWGGTEAYKQSTERTKNWTQEDFSQMKKEQEELAKEIAENMDKGVKSPEVQLLIQKWRDGLNRFYKTTPEICRGLAEMYISDKRFEAYYEKQKTGLAQFIHDSILYYCDQEGNKR